MASPVFQSSQVHFMFSMTRQFKLTSSWFWKNTGDHSSSRIWLLVSLVQANSEFWSVRWSLFWQTGLACFFRGTTHVVDWDWTEQLSRSRTRTRNHLLAVLWSGSGTWRIIELILSLEQCLVFDCIWKSAIGCSNMPPEVLLSFSCCFAACLPWPRFSLLTIWLWNVRV